MHKTRLFYIQICLISNDCVVEEMNVLIYSRHDELRGFLQLSLVDNYQHSINS